MPINSFLYPGAKVVQPFEVSNSLRFNSGSSDGLTRTTGTPTSRKKFTFSTWVKKWNTNISDNHALFSVTDNSTNQLDIRFHHTNEQIEIIDYQGSTQMFLRTSRVFRDPSAWYHIVVTVDTTDATANDRIKFYINGSEETSFASRTNPSLNHDTAVNQTNTRVGFQNNRYYLDGYLAETVFIDGTALDPTSFGEFDEDSGIWKPIDVSGLTFGNNGFYLDFEDSSALGNDVSGNDNDFTVNNLTSIDQTTDTCTNNYATLNPLIKMHYQPSFSNGNLTLSGGTSNQWNPSYSTIGVNSGKWYFESKTTSGTNNVTGICTADTSDNSSASADNFPGKTSEGWGIYTDGNVYNNDATIGSWSGTSFTTNDIIGVAVDLDNNFLYFSKNGTFMNSGDPTSGSSGTGGINISSISGKFVLFGISIQNSTISINYGNPPYTITSGNSDGNSYGNFEYSVPSGYYALNTKNLAEYG